MMLPCCDSVGNWINIGCWSVDSVLVARVHLLSFFDCLHTLTSFVSWLDN